jgi:hypothetical protein
MAATDVVGASVFDERRLKQFNQQPAHERDVIDAYMTLAERTDSEVFGCLGSLIVDDEARHHPSSGELIDAVRADVEVRDVEPPMPRPGRWRSDPQAAPAATESFLRREPDDAIQLKRLENETRHRRDATVWSTVVKRMEVVTDKHIRILELIRDRVKHQLGLTGSAVSFERQRGAR